MKNASKYATVWGVVLTALCLTTTGAASQDTTLTVTVTHIAGQNMYIDAGSTAGISAGDTLRVLSPNPGKLAVVSAASRQSVLAFAGRPFPLTRGIRLTIAFHKSGESALATSSDAPDPPEIEPPPLFDRSPARTTRRNPNRIRITGRFLINLSLLDSKTLPQVEGADVVKRVFITPSLNLNTTISNLPSNVRIRIHVRSDYRHSTILSPTSSFRMYQLNVEKAFDFGQMHIGRFYDRSTSTGGYWDGLSFMMGSRKKGFGASAGFMPDQANEGFTTQFPRFSAFGHVEAGSSRTARYRAGVAYHEIRPNTATSYLQHRYASLDHDLSLGPFYLDQNIQFDQDPTTQGWVVSLFQTNTRFRVTEAVTLRGRYTLRQPYRILTFGNPLSIRRDQAGGGVNFNLLGGSLGGDYRAQFTRGSYDSRTYTAYFNSPRLYGFGLSGSGNQWKSDFGTALFLNGGLSKTVERMQFRFDYGFYRSTNANQAAPIDLHRYSVSVSIPLLERFYWSARTSFQQSEYLRSVSVNTNLQVRF